MKPANRKNIRPTGEGASAPLFTRNFTLLLAGQICSLAGNGILRVVLSLYLLEKTGSAGLYGGVLALGTALAVFLSPLGGVLADRLDRRKLMVGLDTASGLCALAAALGFSFGGGVWLAAGLSVALAVPAALETPVNQACIPGMHTGENLVRANAATAQVSALASLGAPVLGGVLYAAWGMDAALWLIALCFFATAGFECFLRLVPGAKAGEGPLQALAQAVRFVRAEQPRAGQLLVLGALANFFAVGLSAVGFPYLLRTVLGVSAQVYGLCEGLLGAAALAGSIAAGVLAGRGANRMQWALAGMGLAFLPAFALEWLPGSGAQCVGLVALFCAGQALASLFSVFALSALGACTPPAMTGRVMALTAAAVQAAQPAGQLLYGVALDTVPGFWVVTATGAALAVLAVCFGPTLRRF